MRALLIVLASIFFNPAFLSAQENAACGRFFSALRANFSALERFDVIIEEEGLMAMDGFMDFHGAQRLVVDMEKQKALVLRHARYRSLELEQEQHRLESRLILGDKTWTRSLDAPKKMKVSPFAQSLAHAEIYDLSFVGAYPFPTLLADDESGSSNKWEFLVTSANGYGKLLQDADMAKVDVTYPAVETGTPGYQSQTRFVHTFSLDTLTPKSFEWGTIFVSGDGPPQYRPQKRESYRWAEFDGLMLPTRLSASFLIIKAEEDGVKLDNGMREIKLHWESVNDEIPEAMWDPERWGELDEIQRNCIYPETAAEKKE